MVKAKQMLLKCFMIKRLKNYHDSPNIVVILARGRESFSAKYAQFPLTFTE